MPSLKERFSILEGRVDDMRVDIDDLKEEIIPRKKYEEIIATNTETLIEVKALTLSMVEMSAIIRNQNAILKHVPATVAFFNNPIGKIVSTMFIYSLFISFFTLLSMISRDFSDAVGIYIEEVLLSGGAVSIIGLYLSLRTGKKGGDKHETDK